MILFFYEKMYDCFNPKMDGTFRVGWGEGFQMYIPLSNKWFIYNNQVLNTFSS